MKDLPLGLMQMEVGWEHVTCASLEFKMGQMMYSSPHSPENGELSVLDTSISSP